MEAAAATSEPSPRVMSNEGKRRRRFQRSNGNVLGLHPEGRENELAPGKLPDEIPRLAREGLGGESE